MNYELLFASLKERTLKIAVTGACGGFARTLLAQCKSIPAIKIVALCDINTQGVSRLLNELDYLTDSKICHNETEIKAAIKQATTVITDNFNDLNLMDFDMVVESTGQPEISIEIAKQALERGINVGMVSKETDSVAGPWLNRLALQKGAVYTTLDGDQPSNLIGLVTWAKVLGLEIIAAGKSSEYDYIFSPKTGNLTYCDKTVNVPELDKLWALDETNINQTLAARSKMLAMLPQNATPDYCEMNVVANSTGFIPDTGALHYPICHIHELADIFIPKEDGGILQKTGVVDVFNCLRRDDEASFAGGVFIIVRCTDSETWQILAGKGHIVSKNGKYACIYLPYHFMGMETPHSIFSAILHNRPSGSDKQKVYAVMAGHADCDLKKGEILKMGGHHHTINHVSARLLPANESKGLSPFYLLANKKLNWDIKQGELIPLSALEVEDSLLNRIWSEIKP